jgi:hypothetical protein
VSLLVVTEKVITKKNTVAKNLNIVVVVFAAELANAEAVEAEAEDSKYNRLFNHLPTNVLNI